MRATGDRNRLERKKCPLDRTRYTFDPVRHTEFQNRNLIGSHGQVRNKKFVSIATPTDSLPLPRLFYAVIVMLSSMLLFQIQLVMGKMILPEFGGTPSVWSASLLTFQTLLVLGYAYAHLLSKLNFRKQGIIHIVLLVCSALILISV